MYWKKSNLNEQIQTDPQTPGGPAVDGGIDPNHITNVLRGKVGIDRFQAKSAGLISANIPYNRPRTVREILPDGTIVYRFPDHPGFEVRISENGDVGIYYRGIIIAAFEDTFPSASEALKNLDSFFDIVIRYDYTKNAYIGNLDPYDKYILAVRYARKKAPGVDPYNKDPLPRPKDISKSIEEPEIEGPGAFGQFGDIIRGIFGSGN